MSVAHLRQGISCLFQCSIDVKELVKKAYICYASRRYFRYNLNMAIESGHFHNTVDSVKGLLSQHGIKQTSQRVEIGMMLLSSPQHLSADQVLSSVNQDSDIVSKATVYNTLNLFVEKGLIKQVIINSGKVFYDSNPSHHFHLYNEDSGEVMDYEGGSQPLKLDDTLELPKGTIASGVDVIIRVRNKI